MIKYYRMSRDVPSDGAIIYQRSHRLFRLKTGEPVEPDFAPPFIADLDPEFPDGRLPTFFESPALIGKKAFYKDLVAAGVANIETVATIIRHPINGREIHDYLLLNVVGKVSADMQNSKYRSIGPEMNVIDQLAFKPESVGGMDFFVVDEDTDFMIVSERVYEVISKTYDDVLFTELANNKSK